MTENKPIIRSLPIKGNSILKKVEVVSKLIYGSLPYTELSALSAVVTYATNNSLFISPVISQQICLKFGLSKTGLSTSLLRLTEKGLIQKNSKTIIIHPAFLQIDTMDKLLISFSAD